MLRRQQYGSSRADFNDLPPMHYRNAVGQILNDTEIMRDEEIGNVTLALQILEQVQNLRLHRYVQRRGRFVANEYLGLDGQGSGNGDALTFPA